MNRQHSRTLHPLQRFIQLAIITFLCVVFFCSSVSAAGLYVTLDGTGGGFVTSDPPGISCPIANCFADFPDGSTVSLIPTPNSTSTFSGWSNACTNTTGNCSVTMNSATTAGAHFTAAPKTRNVATGTGYPTLGAAYSAANSGDTIMALDSVMPDTGLNIDAAMAQGKSVTIKGGYTADYSGRSLLPTSVHGPLSLGSGSLEVDGLAIIPNDNIGTFDITATSGAHGTVTPTGVTALSLGASQTYTITPNTGYTIAALTVDGSSITPTASYSFSNVQANHTISAIFSAADTTAPSVPADLAGIAVSQTAVNLTWTESTDAVGVTGYRVYRNETHVATPATNSFSDTGLTASTQYAYRVAAYDAAGNVSAQCTAVNVTTNAAPDVTAPSVPTNLAGSATSSSVINLTWAASTDAVGVFGYRIYRNTSQIGTTSTVSFGDSGLTASTQYAYRVAAYDAAGNVSAQCAAVNVTTRAVQDGEVLVDFGTSQNANVFGLSGWSTAIVSPNATYTNAGPGGLTSPSVFDNTQPFYPYAGVTGTSRNFVYGDRIQATWYNNSDTAVSITPLISFVDSDAPSATAGQPQWHSMYPVAYTLHSGTYNTDPPVVRIGARSSVAVNFKILDGTTESATATSAGSHTVVNLSLRSRDTAVPAGVLVLDKIELFHDVDTTPPAAVGNANVHAEAYNKVHLTWTPPTDNVAVTGYRIYRDGKKHYRLDYNASEYVDSYVNAGQTYRYRIVPFDAEMNEGPSATYPVTLPAFGGSDRLIDPARIEYLGAFRVPGDGNYAYSAKGLVYYPQGDAGTGSLFVLGHINNASMSEIAIPTPVISAGKNINDLPSARTLQPLTAITVRPTATWPMMNIGYLPAMGSQTTGKIYTAYYDQYVFSKHTVFGWSETNLSDPQFHGYWSAGPLTGEPHYYAACRFLFEIPQDWSDANMPGYRLMTGYYRPGALNGYGPSLYAMAPWNDGNPPADGAALTVRQVLQYGPFSNDTLRPHKMDGFNMHDRIWDAEWLNSGSASAVAIVADKVYGDSWYGNPSGAVWTRILNNVPSCDENHGWQGTELRPTILMYDPSDLADVVQGRKQGWEPQPYAVLDLYPYMFNTAVADQQMIGGVAYDKTNKILYVEENWGDSQRSLLIHAFRVNSSEVVDTTAPSVPTNLTGAATSSTAVALAWE